ncbi:E3 SUMO-protein ligase RanBP2 [Toxocara canis]|uniref:Nuclear pore complex protein Nup153 n=1 Tax=Toxocara canis TaxID=6265 RepID=A0A0B2UNS4_TOXCA|nr:E3 SUMO-protein ligase RanBP2 [Toxocara canis]
MDDKKSSRSWIRSVIGNISDLFRDSLSNTLDSVNSTFSDRTTDSNRSVRSHSVEEQPEPSKEAAIPLCLVRDAQLRNSDTTSIASRRSTGRSSPSLFEGYPRSGLNLCSFEPAVSISLSTSVRGSTHPVSSDSTAAYSSSGIISSNLNTTATEPSSSTQLNTSATDNDIEMLPAVGSSRKRILNRSPEPAYGGVRTNGHFSLADTGIGLRSCGEILPKKARYSPSREPALGENLPRGLLPPERHSTFLRPQSELRMHSISPARGLRCSSAMQQSVPLSPSRFQRPASSASSLTSRTRAILDQLQKLSDPHYNLPRWRVSNEPERWASDLVKSSVCRSSLKTTYSVPRAKIISDAIYASSFERSRHRWQPRREMNRTGDQVDAAEAQSSSNDTVLPLQQFVNQESLLEKPPLTRPDPGNVPNQNVRLPDVLVSPSRMVTAQPVLKRFDGTTISRRSNVFSAKWPELSVVDRQEASTQTSFDQSLLSKLKGLPKSSRAPQAGFMDKGMFAFAKPVRRGPSQLAQKADAANSKSTPTAECREQSDGSENEMDAAEDVQLISRKKEMLTGVSSSRKGTSEVSQMMSPTETVKPPEPNGFQVEKGVVEGAEMPVIAPSAGSENRVISLEKQWSCKTCFISNKRGAEKCAACGVPRAGAVAQSEATSGKQWSCRTCFISNKADADKCVACGAAKGGGDAGGKTVAQAVSREWFCKECMCKNTTGISKCSACGAPLPTIPVSVFGNRAFVPIAASSPLDVKFGFVSARSSASDDNGSSTGAAASTHAAATAPLSFGLGPSAMSGSNVAVEGGVRPSVSDQGALPKFGLASSSSAPDFGDALKQQPVVNHHELETIEEDKEEQQPATSAATASLFTFGSTAAAAAAQTAQPDKPDITAHTTASGGPLLFGEAGSLTQTASTPVFPTFAAPKSSAPSLIFGSSATPTAGLFRFGESGERPKAPLAFGISASGPAVSVAPVTATAPPFNVAPSINQEGQSGAESKGPMGSNSVEMASTIEATPAPRRPFTFGLAPSTTQSTGLFAFGGAASTAATSSTSNTGGLFSGLNTGVAVSSTMATPFQFGTAQAPVKAFSAPGVVPPVPQTFNFGATSATNGGNAGFTFGSTTTPAVFSFGAQPAAAPTFSFGSAAPGPAAPAFGGLFSGLNTGVAVSSTMATPFQFGTAQAPVKAFSAPGVVPPVPQTFNFGATSATNGGNAGFTFGSTTTPAVFSFGAQPG